MINNVRLIEITTSQKPKKDIKDVSPIKEDQSE